MPKRSTKPSATEAPADPARRIVDAAFDLAAQRPWHTISLADIAAAAGLSLSEVYRHHTSKTAIVAAYMAGVDSDVLAGAASGDNVRERLFDVIMRRFEALGPRKAALRSVLGGLAHDPVGALCTAPRFMRSMTWIAEAAGVDTAGPIGMLRVKGVAGVYLVALRSWLNDDTADNAKTMSALDRALQRAESLAQSLPGMLRRAG